MTEINAQMVKALRDRTGAGMMDCKKALMESSGNEEQAIEIIQKRGLAKAAKKAGAIATEGVVHAYIHAGGRLGVLVEVNCQTDFVARNEDFRAFADLVGLQIASMAPQYVRREEVPEDGLVRRRQLFRDQIAEEDTKSGKKRPEQAVEKIVEGKLAKWLSEVCLVEQGSVQHDEGKTIGAMADELTAKIGEKINVRRFVRYELGEGLDKRKSDLAAEVAAALQTGG